MQRCNKERGQHVRAPLSNFMFRHTHTGKRQALLLASAGRFDPGTESFSDAPSLRDASAWFERCFGVADFTDRPDTRFVEVEDEAFEKAAGARMIVRINFEPRVDEGAYEPAPNGSLVISRITRSQVAVIFPFIVTMLRAERAKSDRCEQAGAHGFQHVFPICFVQDGMS